MTKAPTWVRLTSPAECTTTTTNTAETTTAPTPVTTGRDGGFSAKTRGNPPVRHRPLPLLRPRLAQWIGATKRRKKKTDSERAMQAATSEAATMMMMMVGGREEAPAVTARTGTGTATRMGESASMALQVHPRLHLRQHPLPTAAATVIDLHPAAPRVHEESTTMTMTKRKTAKAARFRRPPTAPGRALTLSSALQSSSPPSPPPRRPLPEPVLSCRSPPPPRQGAPPPPPCSFLPLSPLLLPLHPPLPLLLLTTALSPCPRRQAPPPAASRPRPRPRSCHCKLQALLLQGQGQGFRHPGQCQCQCQCQCRCPKGCNRCRRRCRLPLLLILPTTAMRRPAPLGRLRCR